MKVDEDGIEEKIRSHVNLCWTLDSVLTSKPPTNCWKRAQTLDDFKSKCKPGHMIRKTNLCRKVSETAKRSLKPELQTFWRPATCVDVARQTQSTKSTDFQKTRPLPIWPKLSRGIKATLDWKASNNFQIQIIAKNEKLPPKILYWIFTCVLIKLILVNITII